ncbi:MAG: hypothetical protein ABEH80_03675 [Halobaculum sp.]|jgi:hypothetical protein
MERDSPYVYRDEPGDPVGESDDTDETVVIVEGRATTYRAYRDERERT